MLTKFRIHLGWNTKKKEKQFKVTYYGEIKNEKEAAKPEEARKRSSKIETNYRKFLIKWRGTYSKLKIFGVTSNQRQRLLKNNIFDMKIDKRLRLVQMF